MNKVEEKISIYKELLNKMKTDPNYQPTPEEREAKFYVEHDSSLTTVVNQIQSELNQPVQPTVVQPIQPTVTPVDESSVISPSVVIPGAENIANSNSSLVQDIKETNAFTDEQIKQIEAEIITKGVGISLEEALANIPIYYKTPIKVYNDFKDGVINQVQREFYSDMTTLYADAIAKKKQEEAEKNNTLKFQNGEAGIASIFLLSVVLFVVAVIILLNMN
ncbi:MAG: hypothetical protein IJH20_00625 [Bacilli bacterium]|nr:hypothetical protein [Bacilli bacterium]